MPARGEMTINGERVTAVEYVKRGDVLDLTFKNGDKVVAEAPDMHDKGEAATLVGAANFLRINRGATSGTLEGEALSAHVAQHSRADSFAWPEGKAGVSAKPAPGRENRASTATDPKPAQDSAEVERRAELEKAVLDRFRVEGNTYRFRDGERGVAFRDGGKRLTTASNDGRVARALAELADARGWTSMRVTGNKDFKREAWVEATSRGIAVTGYKPTEQDKALAEKRGQERGQERKTNAVERTEGQERYAAIDAVGRSVAERHGGSEAGREALSAALSRRLDERAAAGPLPRVPIRERSGQEVVRDQERGQEREVEAEM